MKLSKIIQITALLAMVLFSISVANAGEYGTTTKTETSTKTEITQPKYSLEENIPRLEFFANLILSKYSKEELTQQDCFNDVTAKDWFSKHICKAVELGIVSQNTNFRPYAPITIQEAVTAFQRFYGLNFDGVSLYNMPLSYAQKMEVVPTEITDYTAPLTRGTLRDIKSKFEIKAQNKTENKVESSTKSENTQPKYSVEELVSRGEFISAIMSSKYPKDTLPSRDCFKDVPAKDWLAKFACKALDDKIISANENFRPKDPITVQEAVTAFQRFFGLNFDGVSLYNVPLSYAQKMGVVPVEITDYSAPLTRGILQDIKSKFEIKVQGRNEAKTEVKTETKVENSTKTESTQPKYTVEETISRGEFISAIISSKYAKETLESRDCFKDVPASHWLAKHVCKALDLNIISKNDNFRPNDPITVQEAVTAFQRFFGLNLDGVSLYSVPLSYAQKMGVVPTEITDYTAPLTRGTLRDIKSKMEMKVQTETKTTY